MYTHRWVCNGGCGCVCRSGHSLHFSICDNIWDDWSDHSHYTYDGNIVNGNFYVTEAFTLTFLLVVFVSNLFEVYPWLINFDFNFCYLDCSADCKCNCSFTAAITLRQYYFNQKITLFTWSSSIKFL